MADRELLEKAAKAAGMDWLIWTPGLAPIVPVGHRAQPERVCWNPLTDDGDALRLVVKLELKVKYHSVLGQALVWEPLGKETQVNVEDCGHDRCAATRLAITRAAAAIGEGKSHG